EKVIAYEIEPLIPFAPGDIMIDFCVCAPESSEGKEAGVDVLAAAIEKKNLSAWIDGFAGAGLQPEMLVPRGWAGAAVLSLKAPDALLVDVAGDHVTVCLTGKGDVQWVRAFSTGDAKVAKREKRLCDGLRHTLLAYEEETGNTVVPENAFTIGPDGRAADVVKAVNDCLGAAPRPLNLAAESGLITSRQPGHGWDPGQYDTALSLILLKKARKTFLNFRKGEFSPAGRWLAYRHLFGGTAVLAAVTLVLGLLSFFYDFYALHRSISVVDARRQAIFKACFPESAAAPSAETLRYEIDRLRETSGLPEGMKRNFYQIDILNDISRLIPQETDVVITRLDSGVDDVSLSGNTDSFQSVDAMKSRLETSEMFGGVVISSATMDKTDKRVHFKLQVELKL
ncbi:MAG: PilN domain-containing protein, partial [Thermodesulfobacteriota bacterium]